MFAIYFYSSMCTKEVAQVIFIPRFLLFLKHQIYNIYAILKYSKPILDKVIN